MTAEILTNNEILKQLVELDQQIESDFLAELFGVFIRDTPHKVDQLRRAIAEMRMEEARKISHSLKSSFGNLGFEELRLLSGAIQEASSIEEVQALDKLVSELEKKSQPVLALTGKSYRELCERSSYE